MNLPTFPGLRSFRCRFSPSGPHRAQIAPESELKLEKVCRLCRRDRRGAAAVEFAVIAPVFFLLIFGMIEFGRMVMVQQIITNASREGARIAVLDGTTLTQINTSVEGYLTAARISGADIDVTATDDETGNEKTYAQSDYGDAINVTVAIPFGQVSWLPSSFFGNGSTVLTATTVMRRETIQ